MEYIIPESIEDINKMIENKRAYYLAGGTDIMFLKKESELEEWPWVDISRLEELKGIVLEGNFLNIGALTTLAELAYNPLVKENAEAISDAAKVMGSPLIRNLATIGGNLANSNPAGDIIPPVYALDAILTTQKGAEKKEIPVNEFCLGPCDNVLAYGEIISRIKIPVFKKSNSGFLRLGSRKTLALSKVSVAVWWTAEDKKIDDIRIAMGAVGPKCIRAKKTEEFLKKKKITPDLLNEAAEAIEYEACPIDDFRSTMKYRRKMTGVLLKRILKN